MMKRNVSRAAALALAGTMMLGLAACGAPELVNDGSPRPEQEQQVEEKGYGVCAGSDVCVHRPVLHGEGL